MNFLGIKFLIRKTALATLLFFALAACGERVPSYPRRQMPEGLLHDSATARAGKQLFLKHCARCHGSTSEGRNPRADFFNPPAPDFRGRKYRDIAPDYLFWRIAKGKSVEPFRSRGSVMPVWGAHFSDDQIWELVAYLKLRNRENL